MQGMNQVNAFAQASGYSSDENILLNNQTRNGVMLLQECLNISGIIPSDPTALLPFNLRMASITYSGDMFLFKM